MMWIDFWQRNPISIWGLTGWNKFSYHSSMESNPDLHAYKQLAGHGKFWENLEHLRLEEAMFGEEEADALLDIAPPTKKLKKLVLKDSRVFGGSEITPQNFSRFAEYHWFDSLEELEISYHPIGLEGILSLAETPALENLKYFKSLHSIRNIEELRAFISLDWKNLKFVSISFDLTEELREEILLSSFYKNVPYVRIYSLTYSRVPSLNKSF